MIALAPVLFFVVGILGMALSANPTVKEIGRACCWIGLFFLVSALSSKAVHLF